MFPPLASTNFWTIAPIICNRDTFVFRSLFNLIWAFQPKELIDHGPCLRTNKHKDTHTFMDCRVWYWLHLYTPGYISITPISNQQVWEIWVNKPCESTNDYNIPMTNHRPWESRQILWGILYHLAYISLLLTFCVNGRLINLQLVIIWFLWYSSCFNRLTFNQWVAVFVSVPVATTIKSRSLGDR